MCPGWVLVGLSPSWVAWWEEEAKAGDSGCLLNQLPFAPVRAGVH